MVILKLWKDIHPKHIRVENNSICWKNIAPCFEGGVSTQNWALGANLKFSPFIQSGRNPDFLEYLQLPPKRSTSSTRVLHALIVA